MELHPNKMDISNVVPLSSALIASSAHFPQSAHSSNSIDSIPVTRIDDEYSTACDLFLQACADDSID